MVEKFRACNLGAAACALVLGAAAGSVGAKDKPQHAPSLAIATAAQAPLQFASLVRSLDSLHETDPPATAATVPAIPTAGTDVLKLKQLSAPAGVQADLSITKTDGVTNAVAGGSVTYTIVASNSGPNNAPGSTVTDNFVGPGFQACNWTCMGAGGGVCTGSGSGPINDAVNLPTGGTATYTATCSIAPNAIGVFGSLSNTATIAAAIGVTDPTPGNNSASDSDTLVRQADIAVTVTDNRSVVRVGETLNYVITVANPIGPSQVVATVTDSLPAQLTGGSWVCTGSAGANCAGGTGNTLSGDAGLPVGGIATYVYSATLQSAGADLVTNSASATLALGTDPTPANNSANDSDIIVLFKNGFEGPQLVAERVNATGADFASTQWRVDSSLLGRLSRIPTEIARGHGADGRTLFTLELVRFGEAIALRGVTANALGLREPSPWRALEPNQRLLRIAWQSASAEVSDGYLRISAAGTPLQIDGGSERGHLRQILVTVENRVPWLIRIAN